MIATVSDAEIVLDLEQLPAAWFVTYNQYFGPSTINTFAADQFPVDDFLPPSPWEDHVVLAHAGVDQIASRAGYGSAIEYLEAMIRRAGSGA